ncbi:MAG: hypothetical protein D8M59_12460 [Planctomycetes bacterium]|nr:hypothetical protein [Planctomycetota bacterium]
MAVGQRVRVYQQLPRTSSVWSTQVEGELVACGQAQTGSWFAHAQHDRLWLDRIEVRKDDGELVVCNLDQYSRVEVVPEQASAEADEAEAEPAAE